MMITEQSTIVPKTKGRRVIERVEELLKLPQRGKYEFFVRKDNSGLTKITARIKIP